MPPFGKFLGPKNFGAKFHAKLRNAYRDFFISWSVDICKKFSPYTFPEKSWTNRLFISFRRKSYAQSQFSDSCRRTIAESVQPKVKKLISAIEFRVPAINVDFSGQRTAKNFFRSSEPTIPYRRATCVSTPLPPFLLPPDFRASSAARCGSSPTERSGVGESRV